MIPAAAGAAEETTAQGQPPGSDDERLAVVQVAGRRVALPVDLIDRAARSPTAVTPAVPSNGPLVGFGCDAGRPLPLIDAATLLGVARADGGGSDPLNSPRKLTGATAGVDSASAGSANELRPTESPSGAARAAPMIVLNFGGRRCGLIVDAVEGLASLSGAVRGALTKGGGCECDSGSALVSLSSDAPPLLLLDGEALRNRPGMILSETEGRSDIAQPSAQSIGLGASFLSFRSGGTWFAAALEDVQEIVIDPRWERHPVAMPGLRHRIHLRGGRLLVLDPPLGRMEPSDTGIGEPPPGTAIVLRAPTGNFAMPAEEIGNLVRQPADAVSALPRPSATGDGEATHDARSVCASFVDKFLGREVLVLAPEALARQQSFEALFAHEARRAAGLGSRMTRAAPSSASAIAASGASGAEGAVVQGSPETEACAVRKAEVQPTSLLELDIGNRVFVETAQVWRSASLPEHALFAAAGTPAGALGYLRYRGETALAIDMGVVISGAPAWLQGPLRIILLRKMWGLLALVVRDIVGIERFRLDRIAEGERPKEGPLAGGRHVSLISARGREGRQVIAVADIAAVSEVFDTS